MVGKFVEFFGDGLARLPLADRATISNMAPEQGATCVMFPIDDETLALPALHRPPGGAGRAGRGLRARAGHVPRARRGGGDLHGHAGARPRRRRAEPRRAAPPAGPRAAAPTPSESFVRELAALVEAGAAAPAATATSSALRRRGRAHGGRGRGAVGDRGRGDDAAASAALLDHGSVVIAAITSCTNTSNPAVMVGAGLLAKQRASSAGCARKPWVKTSLAPGSKVVTEYLERVRPHRAARGARLQPRRLRLHDLHRELRPAAGGDLRRDRAGRPRGRVGAVRATGTSRAASTPR